MPPTNRKLAPIAGRLIYSRSPDAEKLLRALIEQNPSREAKGQASFALGEFLVRQADMARHMKEDAETAGRIEQFLGKETADRLRAQDTAALLKAAEAQFEKIAADFGDLKHFRGDLAKAAKAQLFELRNLTVGRPAPTVVGEDLDGKPMSLAEYKGKVVMLDFWGDW